MENASNLIDDKLTNIMTNELKTANKYNHNLTDSWSYYYTNLIKPNLLVIFIFFIFFVFVIMCYYIWKAHETDVKIPKKKK